MNGNLGSAMSVGDGIFGGLVFLGLVALYAVTRDRWRWKRIAKWLGVAIIVLGVVVWPALKSSFLWQWMVGLMIIFSVLGVVLKRVVVGFIERFFLGYVGDVVRYLNPDPPNVDWNGLAVGKLVELVLPVT